jgi:peptidoglycan/xylan/chitin deacetylase (PgdA/CDA1 family)
MDFRTMSSSSSPIKVGLIFDDGFVKSTFKTAAIFDEFKIPAVFAVLADSVNFVPGCGDWTLWNDLQSRGHIIHPHGQTHVKLSEIPPADAIASVQQCLDSFEENLTDFDPAEALYAFTYNTGTPETIEYLLPKVRAVRIGGNPLLTDANFRTRIWTNQTFGPADPFEDFQYVLAQARQHEPRALFYCFHGLDDEYWGATTTDHLRQILETITTAPDLAYWDLT